MKISGTGGRPSYSHLSQHDINLNQYLTFTASFSLLYNYYNVDSSSNCIAIVLVMSTLFRSAIAKTSCTSIPLQHRTVRNPVITQENFMSEGLAAESVG